MTADGQAGRDHRSENRIGAVIHGMSRSGTSAVAGLFAAAGYHLGGPDELMPATDANPGGYYEHRAIFALNEEILSFVGGSWFDPPTDAQLEAHRGRFEPQIAALFKRLIDESLGRPVAIKDPRLGVMMTLWNPIIGRRLHPVLVIRHPVEIARSLQRRDGTPWPFSLASWENQMTRTLGHLHGCSVTPVQYARLLSSPETAAALLSSVGAQLDPGRRRRASPDAGSDWLDRGLRHNVAGDGERDVMLTGHQGQLWEWLSSLPLETAILDVPEPLRVTAPLAAETAAFETARIQALNSHAEAGATIQRLTAQVGELEASRLQLGRQLARERAAVEALTASQQRMAGLLAEVVGSRSWRLTEPARRAATGVRRIVGRGERAD